MIPAGVIVDHNRDSRNAICQHVVCPSIPNSAFVVMDSHEMPFVKRWSVPSVVWNEFSNAYSQNKSAEMPLVQRGPQSHMSFSNTIGRGRSSQKVFSNAICRRYVSKGTKSRLEPYNYISCLEPSDPPTARTTNFQQTSWSKFGEGKTET
jgi:hypothetical protein